MESISFSVDGQNKKQSGYHSWPQRLPFEAKLWLRGCSLLPPNGNVFEHTAEPSVTAYIWQSYSIISELTPLFFLRIQSVWRGYVVRKWYVKLRQTIPPKDPRLRKKFYEDKLHEITDRMVAMTNGESVDRFLQDIDQSIASSRKIFQHFEDSCVRRLSNDDWVDIEIKALKREDKDCPICLRDLVNQDPAGEVNEKPKIEMGKHSKEYKHCNARSSPTKTESSTLVTKPFLALLSCSHLFHAKCLEALEEFYVMDNPVGFENSHHGMSPLEIPQPFFHCPMCRSLYVKKII